VTDPEWRTTSYVYDMLGRRTQILNAAIQAAPLWRQTYTANGLAASLRDANNNTTFAYDGFDRLATATYPNNRTETFTYDANGRVTRTQDKADDTVLRSTGATCLATGKPATTTDPTATRRPTPTARSNASRA
jgi:YD repeat-containing protein